MKKILFFAFAALASALSLRGETYTDGAPSVDGATVTMCTAVSDFTAGAKYIIRSHNILWEKDKYLYLDGTSVKFAELSAISDLSAAQFTLEASTAAVTDFSNASVTIDARSEAAYCFKQDGKYLSFNATATTTTNTATTNSVKLCKVSTLPASPSLSGDSDAEIAANNHASETGDFFMFNFMASNKASVAFYYNSGTSQSFGAFSGALYYNLLNIGTNLRANFKNAHIDPFFVVYRVDYVSKESYADSFNSAMSTKENMVYGSAPGEYAADTEATVSEKWTALEAAYNASPFVVADYTSALTDFNAYVNGLAHNPVADGSFIRIRNYSGGYLSMPATGDNSMIAAAEPSTLFYRSGRNLISYTEGCAVAVAGGIIKGRSTVETNSTQGGLNDNGYYIDFVNHPVWTAHDIKTNRFMIRHDGGGKTTFGGTTATADLNYATGTWADMSTSGAANTNGWHYVFTVENVTELPVAIHSDGFGSLIAPVAVIAPASADTYVCAVDGTKVTFTAIDAGETIAAGSHIYFKAAEGTLNVTIAQGADAAQAGDLLVGSHMLTCIDAEEGYDYYAKTAVAPQSAAVRPMMMNTAEGSAPAIRLVKLTPADGKVTVPAATSVVKVTAKADSPQVISINPNEGLETTGIRDVAISAAGTSSAFDLQGRRIAGPTHGLYIRNGKLMHSR